MTRITAGARRAGALAAASISAISHAAGANCTASATVIAPITIRKSVDLSFGRFAAGAGGTVTVSTSDARTATGAILSTVGSSPAAARFVVAGAASATYSITISPAAAMDDGAGHAMTLAIFSDLSAANTTSGNVTGGALSGAGAQSVFIGATLTVGAAQIAGEYSGNILVTVEYN